MKQLQNNYTTQEQSKRLLVLGVPADSADMMYYPEFTENLYSSGNGDFRMSDTPKVLRAYEKFSNSTRYDSDKIRELCAPCWSVGRLMEIIDICSLGENSDPNTEEYPSTIKVMNKLHISYVEYLVKTIERGMQLGIIDFSKLED